MDMAVGQALLDQVMELPSGGAPSPLASQLTAAPRPQPRAVVLKLNYAHDAMIDLILSDPGISQNEIARRMGYSASWVSQLVSSDAFQARLAERSKEIVDPVLRATVEEQFRGVLARSLDIVRQKLNREAAEVPDNLALRTLELSSRALGYGARNDTVNVNIDAGERLAALGDNLTKLLTRKRSAVLEGEFDEQPDQRSTGG